MRNPNFQSEHIKQAAQKAYMSAIDALILDGQAVDRGELAAALAFAYGNALGNYAVKAVGQSHKINDIELIRLKAAGQTFDAQFAFEQTGDDDA